MNDRQILRLTPQHAASISECFYSVYGDSYANELFYDVASLSSAIASGRLRSVGAVNEQRQVIAHMAMVCHRGALFAELGNTVVSPAARGGGLAWQVGNELTAWCTELGYRAYLHYPTTDHHIMQRQSVKSGYETGLMLGYIPAETDGKVTSDKPALRGAATVVVNPLGKIASQDIFVPGRFLDLIQSLVAAAGLPRKLVDAAFAEPTFATQSEMIEMPRRGVTRLEIARIGEDCDAVTSSAIDTGAACVFVDFLLSDMAINVGVEAAVSAGFVFCAWMPGYRSADVLRMQRFDHGVTDFAPAVVNPGAQRLLGQILAQAGVRDHHD